MTNIKVKVGLYCFGKNHAIDKYFQMLRVFNKMIEDGHFDPVILVDGTGSAEKDLRRYYDDKPIEFIDLRDNNINSLGLDYIVIIDPYNKPIIPFEEIKVPIIYKEYGVAGAELNAGYLINKPVYKYASLIVTENPYMSEKIKDKYPGKHVLVGSPAFDYVFDNYYEDPRFKDGYIHLLWTPHHSIVENPGYDKITGGRYSTFLTYKDYFANELLSTFDNVVLHIKPHPILRGRYNHAYGKFNDYLNSFSDPSRVFIHEKEDFSSLFMKSDILLNDSISFIQEWLPVNKPMIVLEDEDKASYSSYGEDIVSNYYYRARSSEEITKLITILMTDDPKKRARSYMINSLYPQKGLTNTEFLLRYLLDWTKSKFINGYKL